MTRSSSDRAIVVPAAQNALFTDSPFPTPDSRLIAGVDEAGRGPLAGPVAVAAVVFDPAKPRINGLDDSKQLSAERREQLYARIVDRALAWSVVLIDSEEIDRINIYQATMLGMRRAVEGVAHVAGFARIDGNRVPKGLPCPAEALIGGDALDRAIMAASIVAKVTRDRLMRELHAQHPNTASTCTRATALRPIWRPCRPTGRARSTGAALPRCAVRWGWRPPKPPGTCPARLPMDCCWPSKPIHCRLQVAGRRVAATRLSRSPRSLRIHPPAHRRNPPPPEPPAPPSPCPAWAQRVDPAVKPCSTRLPSLP